MGRLLPYTVVPSAADGRVASLLKAPLAACVQVSCDFKPRCSGGGAVAGPSDSVVSSFVTARAEKVAGLLAMGCFFEQALCLSLAFTIFGSNTGREKYLGRSSTTDSKSQGPSPLLSNQLGPQKTGGVASTINSGLEHRWRGPWCFSCVRFVVCKSGERHGRQLGTVPARSTPKTGDNPKSIIEPPSRIATCTPNSTPNRLACNPQSKECSPERYGQVSIAAQSWSLPLRLRPSPFIAHTHARR